MNHTEIRYNLDMIKTALQDGVFVEIVEGSGIYIDSGDNLNFEKDADDTRDYLSSPFWLITNDGVAEELDSIEDALARAEEILRG